MAIGVVIGPEATSEALKARRRELQSQPERFIAQETIALSTHPTFDGEGMYPHHVDLRAFVHLRPDATDGVTAEVMPAGLTRVAAAGRGSSIHRRAAAARTPGYLDRRDNTGGLDHQATS